MCQPGYLCAGYHSYLSLQLSVRLYSPVSVVVVVDHSLLYSLASTPVHAFSDYLLVEQ